MQVENQSPFRSETLITGHDAAGFPEYTRFNTGDIIKSANGATYRVLGFLKSGEIIATADDGDEAIHSVNLRPLGLSHAPPNLMAWLTSGTSFGK